MKRHPAAFGHIGQFGVFFTLSILAASSWSLGATRRDDVADASYTALSALPAYASSGYISIDQNSGGFFVIGSGTLIAPNWVLTAAHVVTHDVSGTQTPWPNLQITFGQDATRPGSLVGSFNVSQVVVAPGWTGDLSNGTDMALIQLSTNVAGVTPAPLYDATTLGSELSKNATVVGYQGATGTGLTGNNTSDLNRRALTNVVDLIGSATTTSSGTNSAGAAVNYGFGNISPKIMFTDFDSPDSDATPNADPSNFYNLMGSGDPTATEGASVPGDSGGGLFIDVSGTSYLAGVTSFVGNFSNTPFTHNSLNGFYGDFNGYSRVSQFLSFINTTVPEPATLSLLALAGLLLPQRGLARRRKPTADEM